MKGRRPFISLVIALLALGASPVASRAMDIEALLAAKAAMLSDDAANDEAAPAAKTTDSAQTSRASDEFRVEPGVASDGPPSLLVNANVGAPSGVVKVGTVGSGLVVQVTCPSGFTFPADAIPAGGTVTYRCGSGGIDPTVRVQGGAFDYPAFFGEWVEFFNNGTGLRNHVGSYADVQGSRFRLFISWILADLDFGVGERVPFGSNVTAFFSYDLFDPNDYQVIAKVINACSNNNRYWVFAGAATNLYVTVVAWDRATGAFRTYSSPLGQNFASVSDTQAFATCP